MHAWTMRRLSWLLVAMAAAFVMAGCGGSKSSGLKWPITNGELKAKDVIVDSQYQDLYRAVAIESGNVKLTVEAKDNAVTVIVRYGPNLSELTQKTQVNVPAGQAREITFDVVKGTTYWIYVIAEQNKTAEYTLSQSPALLGNLFPHRPRSPQ